jgi:hypothetical protein
MAPPSLVRHCLSGGEEDWIVHCDCGTADDDGERMVACERCNQWRHTRCLGVPDEAPPPDPFVCPNCRAAEAAAKRAAAPASGR